MKMLSFIFLFTFIALQFYTVSANTEKVIFLGPGPLQIPIESPTLEDLQLEILSPEALSVRAHVEAQFPTTTSQRGVSTWILLHGLKEGKRYEVRICWAATVRLQYAQWAKADLKATHVLQTRYIRTTHGL